MFKSKTIIVVDSVVYNMAGDYPDRANYVRSLLLNSALGGNSFPAGLMDSFINGPKANFRNFLGWTRRNLPEALPQGSFRDPTPIDPVEVRPYIPALEDYDIYVEEAWVGPADYVEWAEDYLYITEPEILDSDWTADIIPDANPTGWQVIIYLEDETTRTFIPSGFVADATYVYARYYYLDNSSFGDREILSTGPVIGPVTASGLPNMDGWTLEDTTTTPRSVPLVQVVETETTYSDPLTPPEYDTESIPLAPGTYTETRPQYYRVNAKTTTPEGTSYALGTEHEQWNIRLIDTVVTEDEVTEEIAPGEFKTTKTTTTTQVLGAERFYYQQKSTRTNLGFISTYRAYRYQIGTGIPALDAKAADIRVAGDFFPVLPIRLNNRFINEPWYDAEKQKKIAQTYKKITNGGKFEDLIEDLKDNDKLGDLDYVFLTFGVPLNAKNPEGQRYIYEFFNYLESQQTNVKSAMDDAEAYAQAYQEWLIAVASITSDYEPWPPAPAYQGYALPRKNSIRMRISGLSDAYQMDIHWSYVQKSVHSGSIEPGAKKGKVLIQKLPNRIVYTSHYQDMYDSGPEVVITSQSYPRFEILFQDTASAYTRLEVVGAEHVNTIYGGKAAVTDSTRALDDIEDSGFLVPLYYPVLKLLPAVAANQLVTESYHMVINCYVTQKVKWYQRGIFKVLLAAVIIFASALFIPGGWAAGTGLLGANVSVGLSLGASAAMAAVVGAAANAIAAAILSQIVGKVSVALFGQKIGAIVSAFISLGMSMDVGGLFGGDFQFDWGFFSKPEFLLKLTDALSSIHVAVLQGKMQDLQAESLAMAEDYERTSREISDKLMELRGAQAMFDFTQLLEATRLKIEPRDQYLSRTLLTAADMREITTDLINEYVEMNLALPDAFA